MTAPQARSECHVIQCTRPLAETNEDVDEVRLDVGAQLRTRRGRQAWDRFIPVNDLLLVSLYRPVYIQNKMDGIWGVLVSDTPSHSSPMITSRIRFEATA